MAVKLSLNGRAPIVVTDHHVAMLDRSAFTVNIYKYDNQKFIKIFASYTFCSGLQDTQDEYV